MPIGGLFKDQFKAGDVIYGFSGARRRYFESLPLSFMTQLESVGQYLTINEYNGNTFGTLNSPETPADIHANLEENKRRPDLSPLEKASLDKYYKILKMSRYAPLEAVGMELAQAKTKGNDMLSDLVFRRASKFGLQYVIEQLRCTVHFVIDHPRKIGEPLDFQDIIAKKRVPICRNSRFKVPVTMSELRCCYRNRHWTRLGRLKFYVNFTEVPAPWDADPERWATYGDYRNNKYNGAAPLPPRAERPPLPLKQAHLLPQRAERPPLPFKPAHLRSPRTQD